MSLNRTLLACVVLTVALMSSESFAQGRGGGRGGPGGMMGDSPLTLINDKSVIEELELVDDQVEALNDLQDDMRDVFRESFSGMRDRFRDKNVDRESLMDEIREKIQSQMADVETDLNEILLPHQATRLDELYFQMQASRSGTDGMLSNPKVKERLGLTDEQIDEIKAKAEEVKADLDKKIAGLREEAREEILSVLSSDQQKQIKEMMGDSFEFEQGGRGRGGPGGRVGPGGDRGGRGGPGGDRGSRGGPGGRPDRER
jgi:Spy/CpxP family protein refolding chaperone